MNENQTETIDLNESARLSLAPDLTKQAPRSPRCRLGGYAILPRLLDKCRAHIRGVAGEYHFNCPIDQQFLSFVDIDADALRQQARIGKTDGEMLEWIQANARLARTPWEIEQWSVYQESRAPDPNSESGAYFVQLLRSVGPNRHDVQSWMELLDLDDYCSFGGAA